METVYIVRYRQNGKNKKARVTVVGDGGEQRAKYMVRLTKWIEDEDIVSVRLAAYQNKQKSKQLKHITNGSK